MPSFGSFGSMVNEKNLLRQRSVEIATPGQADSALGPDVDASHGGAKATPVSTEVHQ